MSVPDQVQFIMEIHWRIADWGNRSCFGDYRWPRSDRNIVPVRTEWRGMGLRSFVTLTGAPPTIEPPPTFTPITVSTLDPSIIATFSLKPTETRLPTFTPPAPLSVPTFSDAPVETSSHFPFGTGDYRFGCCGNIRVCDFHGELPLMCSRKLFAFGVFIMAIIFACSVERSCALFVYAQQPTGSIPTVTGTPPGPVVTVYLNNDQVDVYAGPSSYDYPAVGVMLAGQQAPALGRVEGLDWIEIQYVGIAGSIAWIYAPYVSLTSGSTLPIVPVPPTPMPASTPTIIPTLVAA